MVNTFNMDAYIMTVNRVEVCAVERPYIQQNNLFWRLSTQQFDSFTSAICRCTVLPNHPKCVKMVL